MHTRIVAALLCLLASAANAAEIRCEGEAAAQAERLLKFHVGDEVTNRKAFEPAKAVASLKNPAKPAQVFSVLEVKAFVSPKGEYRMRFIFAPVEIGCILMGQEILEIAKL